MVDECISRDVLTVDIIRRFSARTRSYELEGGKDSTEKNNNSSDDAPIPHKRVETLKKILKCRRAAIDFDKGIIIKTVCAKDFDIKKDLLDKDKKLYANARVKPKDKKHRKRKINNKENVNIYRPLALKLDVLESWASLLAALLGS